MDQNGAMKGCTFLINPTRHPSSAKVLKKILKRKTDAAVIESATKEALKEEVARFCSSSSRYLLLWGGDGTVHEAINSIMENRVPGKALGFLRGGTGNGIQDSYEIPHRLSKQISTYTRSVNNNYVEKVDLLKIDIGGRIIYGQLLGIGYDVDVLKIRKLLYFKDIHNSVKPGIRYYILSAFKIFRKFDFRSIPETEILFKKGKYALKGIKINAEYPFRSLIRRTRSVIIEIGTRPYYGRLFRICPDVVCNDGNMDAYLYQLHDHLSVVANLLSLWKGWHHRINARLAKKKKPLIERYEVKEAVVKTGVNTDFHIDGELFNTGDSDRIKVSIVPGAIDFLVPESFYQKFHPFDREL